MKIIILNESFHLKINMDHLLDPLRTTNQSLDTEFL